MINRLVNKIKTDGWLSIFSSLITKFKMRLHAPNLVIEKCKLIPICLGSQYGGKRFFDFHELFDTTIVSCGLGEDASFDIQFALTYNAKVIILDPTPTAITHFEGIIDRIGSSSNVQDQAPSHKDVEGYNLTGLSYNQLVLEKFALWTNHESLRFFAPKNPKHTSYSITNYQNDYKLDSDFEYIKVDAVTIESILEKYNIHQLQLLKLDIEGAEIDVLKDMLKKRIYPTQIAVEFDGLNHPSKRAKLDSKEVDRLLRQHGYLCYHFDGIADFLYVLSSKVDTELAKYAK
tara:strand:- start:1962 stop:2828 length:867 start_codon:yes stop_codon:yes gene_type:complete